MQRHRDLKRYYQILSVSIDASAVEIKTAYRRLAKEQHPDRHPLDSNATAKFQLLNEAYSVLNDPIKRSAYDKSCHAKDGESKNRRICEPVKCEQCNIISAQPRFVNYFYVVGLLFTALRRSESGVFCSTCASKKAFKANSISWIFGWWGFPWAPFWTIATLFRNALSGAMPAAPNVHILGQQALYFLETNNIELAAAAIDQALLFDMAAPKRAEFLKIRNSISSSKSVRLADNWKQWKHGLWWLQFAFPLMFSLFLVCLNAGNIQDANAKHVIAHVSIGRISILSDPNESALSVKTLRPYENFTVLEGRDKNGFDRIVTGDGVVGYIPESAVILGDGEAAQDAFCFPSGPVSLENGEILRQTSTGPHTLRTTNGLSQDAVVKLRDMAYHTVVSFYVSAGQEVTLNDIPEGSYYIEFATGLNYSLKCGYFLNNMTVQRFSDIESFQMQVQGNSEYSTELDISLNPVPGGTAETTTTESSQFDQD